MTKKTLKWIKTFEESIALSNLYDTGAGGAFNRWKNANPALEFEEEFETLNPFPNTKIKELVYHGTTDKSYRSYQYTYFTADIDYASKYAEPNGRILKCYVNIENPFIINAKYMGYGEIVLHNKIIGFYRNLNEDAVKLLTKEGYDGIIVHYPEKNKINFEVIPFDNSQIFEVGDIKINSSIQESIDYSEDKNLWKYKFFIKKLFRNLKKAFFLDDDIIVKDIKIIGSYGTPKWKRGKSDIDFAVETEEPLPPYLDFLSVIDYLNSELLKEFGEVEGKAGFVEILVINDMTIFKALGME